MVEVSAGSWLSGVSSVVSSAGVSGCAGVSTCSCEVGGEGVPVSETGVTFSQLSPSWFSGSSSAPRTSSTVAHMRTLSPYAAMTCWTAGWLPLAST